MVEAFLILSYILGTIMGYVFSRSKVHKIVEEVIDNLITQGYLRADRQSNGEYEIKKWNER